MQRSDRVGDEMQKIIADIIQNDIKDPRLPPLVSITEVRVSRDLSHASIYVSVMGDSRDADGQQIKKECTKALRSATGYIRREMSSRMRLRIAPELHFIFDDSIERGIRMAKLIDEAMGGRPDSGRRGNG